MTERLKAQLDLLRTQLGADKKKAAILGTLAVVLLVVVGRLFLSSGPEPITAAPPPLAAPAVAVQPTASSSPPSMAAGAEVRTRTGAAGSGSVVAELIVEEGSSKQRVVSVSGMPRDLARDLFNTTEWNKFMPAVLAGAEAPSGAAGRRRNVGLWGQLRQSWSEYNREQQDLSEAFQHDLEKLQLNSTLTGAEPMAHISGRLVRSGDDILGFSVIRIADREVVVSRGGMTASLTMK